MKNRNHVTTHKSEDLLDDLRALVSEAEKMLGDSIGEHTSEAATALRERFAAAQERFSELYDGARKKITAGARYTDETIRENPYQSIAIAAGVGLLLGVLVGRRSK